MLTSRAWGIALACFSSLGCLSGQTGSPDCVGPTSCVCDTLYGGGALLRVHGEAAADGSDILVVDEVLGTVHGSPADLRVGDRVGGSVTAEKPCDPDSRSTTPAREDSLVLFIPGVNDHYPRCESEAEVCAERRETALRSGELRFVVPWNDELDFGAGHRLASTDVDSLLSVEACWQRFPLGPTPPCDDSPGAQCGVSRSLVPHGASLGSVLLGALVATSLRWRRTRRGPGPRTSREP